MNRSLGVHGSSNDWLGTDPASTESLSAPDDFRLGYRGDIEGLRAAAILLVVAAHAGVPWLEGGYVGVDVFFVLSGYLISGLLVQEIRATGGLRLLRFYARRLRRLLPALLFMLAGTMIIAAVLLAPFEQWGQAPAGAAASTWLSNLFFAFSKLDYFSPAAETNLFLHTWSLGVEEQFYLFWPALLMFLLGAWRWQGATQNFTRLRSGLVATIAICLVLSIFLTHTQPSWGFYLMPSRAWQFALGALALLWSTECGSSRASGITGRQVSDSTGRFVTIGGWVGVTLILATAVLLNAQTPYPGGWALIPSAGTVAVLMSGSIVSRTGVGGVLSLRPLQGIGRVSYAWYLWHWPILLLGSSLDVVDKPVNRVGLVGLSLALAIFSYLVIEKPIRRSTALACRPGLALTVAVVLMAGAFAANVGWQSTATRWSQLPEQRRYQEVRSDLPILYGMGCDEWFYSATVRVCLFGPEDAEHTAVVIGDSITLQWFPAIASAYSKLGWRLLVLTKSACPMVDESYFYVRIGREYIECNVWRQAALKAVRSFEPDVLMMGSSAGYPFTHSQWVTGTKRVLDIVGTAAPNVFVIRGTYSLPFDGPGCLSRRDWRTAFLSLPGDCSAPAGSRRETEIHKWLIRAANDYPNVTVLDLNALVCPNGRCSAERGGKVIFRDASHLSARYVETLDDAFANKIYRVRVD